MEDESDYELQGRIRKIDNGQRDAATGMRDLERYEAVGFNLDNMFCKVGFWVMDAFQDFRKPADMKTGLTDDDVERLTVNSNLFNRELAHWVGTESRAGRFMCTVCGRQSIVDVTAVMGRKETTGSGVCMCCLTMPTLNVITLNNLQPHAVNDAFSQYMAVELSEVFGDLDVYVSMDRTIKSATNPNLSRPDTLIYLKLKNGGQYMCSLFLECDPRKLKPSHTDVDRDDKILKDPNNRVPELNRVSVMIRYNTTVNALHHSNSDLYNALWELCLVTVSCMRTFLLNFAAGVPEEERYAGHLYLNYNVGICTKHGFRLFTDQRWLAAMAKPLRQEGDRRRFTSRVTNLRGSVNENSPLANIHRSKLVLLTILRDFDRNGYFLEYMNRVPTLAFLTGDYRAAAAQQDGHVDMRLFKGLGEVTAVQKIDPHTVRLGKILLFRYLLRVRQRHLFAQHRREQYSNAVANKRKLNCKLEGNLPDIGGIDLDALLL